MRYFTSDNSNCMYYTKVQKVFATQFLLMVTANINIRVWRYSPGINSDTTETGC